MFERREKMKENIKRYHFVVAHARTATESSGMRGARTPATQIRLLCIDFKFASNWNPQFDFRPPPAAQWK